MPLTMCVTTMSATMCRTASASGLRDPLPLADGWTAKFR
jgi:hypothetical protein